MCRLIDNERFTDDRDRIATVLQRELDILRQRQGADGGWGTGQYVTQSGGTSTSFNTASVLAVDEARDRGFEIDMDMVQDGINCVERMRLPSGTYVYGTYAQPRAPGPYNMVGITRSLAAVQSALMPGIAAISLAQMRTGVEALRDDHHYIEIKARSAATRPTTRRPGSTTSTDTTTPDGSSSGLMNPIGSAHLAAGRHGRSGSRRAGSTTALRLGHAYGTAYGILVLQACHRALADDADASTTTAVVPETADHVVVDHADRLHECAIVGPQKPKPSDLSSFDMPDWPSITVGGRLVGQLVHDGFMLHVFSRRSENRSVRP